MIKIENSVVPLESTFSRLPIFVPVKRGGNTDRVIEINKFYGYSNVKISGPQLSQRDDFEIFTKIIIFLDRYGFKPDDGVVVPFRVFLQLQKGEKLRRHHKDKIEESFKRISEQVIDFTVKESRVEPFNIITTEVDMNANTIKFICTKNISKLYLEVKNFVYFLVLSEYNNIRGEVAKCLFLFHSSHDPKFKNFRIKSIRDRIYPESSLMENESTSGCDAYSAAYTKHTIKKAYSSLRSTGHIYHFHFFNKNGNECVHVELKKAAATS